MNGHDGIAVPRLSTYPLMMPSRRTSGNMAFSESEDEDRREDSSEKKKRKRNRIQLSCIQCKRRKVKCSRTSPCEACVRHGCADECKWEEGSGAEQIQPFAMASDLRNLESRYRILEKYVVDKLAVNSGELASLLSEVDTPPPLSSIQSQRIFESMPTYLPRMSNSHAGKDEDAAQVLEELAMGKAEPAATRSPATHMKPREALTTIMLSQPIDASERMSFVPPHECLTRIFSSLPSDPIIVSLTEANSNWFAFKGIFHRPTVIAEMHEFLDARRRDNLSYIDPAWLAFFLSLLVAGLNDLGDFETHIAGVPIRDLQKSSPFWLSASRAALNLSNYFVTPQYRALQTLAMYTHFGSRPLGRNRNKGVGVWLASAVRVAQALGYDKLGSDEYTMPADDPGLPAGSSPLKRQMALRLWSHLLAYDTVLALPNWRFPYLIREGEFDSVLPANVNDEDLATQDKLVERPLSEFTEASITLVKARMMRFFRQASNVIKVMDEQTPEQAAQTALEFDRKQRRAVDAFDSEGPKELRPMVQSGLMARMLRFHRPFVQKYYDGDIRFAESTRAALEDAYSVCSAVQTASATDFAFLLRHTFLAVVTLFQHRFAMIKRGTPERDAIETSNAIDLAATCFARHRMNKYADLRLMAENGLSLLLALREAETTFRLNPHAETFGEVVKRLGDTHFTVSNETLTALANNASVSQWATSTDNSMANGASILPGVEAVPVVASLTNSSLGPEMKDPALLHAPLFDETNLFQFDWSTLINGDNERFELGGPF